MLSPTVSRGLWLIVIALIAILAFKTRDNFAVLFTGVGTLTVDAASSPDTVVMSWSGQVEAPMEQRIAETFERHKATAKTFVLSLSSPGGSVDHGGRVARVLRRISESHRLETVVEARRFCASMCVPLYLQGQRRTAAARARFMFHQVSFSDFFSEEKIEVPDGARASATRQFFMAYFKPAGVPARWIEAMLTATADGDNIWKTAEELVEERAGIVQSVY